MKLSVALFLSGVLLHAQNQPPKLIDCHVHHNGQKAFLDQLTKKMDALDGMALLITAPADLKDVTRAMAEHPGRLAGLGEIRLDDPQALALVDRFHEAGFRGLGEITQPQYPYDDRRYWPIYERAAQYGMILLFHTGIVNRTRSRHGFGRQFRPDARGNARSDRAAVPQIEDHRRAPRKSGLRLGGRDRALESQRLVGSLRFHPDQEATRLPVVQWHFLVVQRGDAAQPPERRQRF